MNAKIGSWHSLLLFIIFFLPAKFCAAEALKVSDELNPTKAVSKLAWQKKGADDKPTFCSLDVSDEAGNEIKNMKISAAVFETKIINSKKGDDLNSYETKLRALGFDMNRIKSPSNAYYFGSNLSDGACGGTVGYVRIREGKVRVVCINSRINPCSGAGDDAEPEQEIASTYSVVVSKEFSVSEILSDVRPLGKSEKNSTNKK